MKNAKKAFLLLSVMALAACSTPMPVAQSKATAAAPVASVTQFANPEVNEAAGAYVTLYKETIEKSVQERRYQGELAYRHLSAEACFDSRANRLLAREVTAQEKETLMLSHVSIDKLKAYQELAKGYFPRINGMELFTCDRAGLRVALNSAKY
ncbi:hypothetical protein LPB72_06715 [Hydrogenophaga crassostreae]|uniref:Uncharacterized protein n=1 Tax=Hydrogenophaga crassostreae TaxID=1763535 RepID=A0A162P963_9BURK|nr:hypothetical protein [Hydrogenophaga crassostreae]AOW13247.1 hypothetical protein LPB072_10665 [Hydrogenophaga crassostreae]OAD42606.1 hypothetical protein LPB72_06715 [Hydrogenophaga crassostreae]